MTNSPSKEGPPDQAALARLLAAARAELEASRKRESELRHELEHRVRNALAVTRSVFSRTMTTAVSLEDARNHLGGRLDALARYHRRFATTPNIYLDLESMVWDELLVVASASDWRIAVAGPAVQLAGNVAEVIGLALHELATNSVKFGVLAEPGGSGKLQIDWQEQNGEIQFAWIESGVPIVVSAPIASGFGQEYIEQALPYQLGAQTTFALVAGGLVCRMKFSSGQFL